MKTGHYAAIVLAAGFSHRMQCFKPLLPLGGKTITDHVMNTYIENGVDIYLVVGYMQNELRAGIKTRNIQIVENPDYQRGMFTSIQAGIRSLKEDYKAVFIAPVDIPLVSSATIRILLIAAEDHPGKVICPVYRQNRGHPPLIPAKMFSTILDWRGEGGLNSIISTSEEVVEVNVLDSNIFFDIDETGHYIELLDRFQRDIVP